MPMVHHVDYTPKFGQHVQTSELCATCHTEKATPVSFKHAPVAGEQGCLSCHSAHSTDNARLLNADGTMKDPSALKAVFDAAGVDLAKPVITSCGSGVTAAVLALALERIGHRNWALYDGSWAEWGMYDDLKVAKG